MARQDTMAAGATGWPTPSGSTQVPDGSDNCVGVANPGQEECGTGSPLGKACDPDCNGLHERVDPGPGPGEVDTVVTVTQDGEPLAGVAVLAYHAAGPPAGPQSVTDPRGQASFPLFAGLSYYIEAPHRQFAYTSGVFVAPAEVTIAVPPFVGFSLRVTSGGDPVAEVLVQAYGPDDEALGPPVRTDAQGTIDWRLPEDLAPVRFVATHRGVEVRSEASFPVEGGMVEFELGSFVEVELTLTAGSNRGPLCHQRVELYRLEVDPLTGIVEETRTDVATTDGEQGVATFATPASEDGYRFVVPDLLGHAFSSDVVSLEGDPASYAWTLPGFASTTVTLRAGADPVPGTNLLWWGEREAQGGLIAAQDHLGNARTDAQGRATFLLVDRTRHGQEEGWTGTGYRWDVRGLLGRNASSPPYQAPEYAWPPALDAWDFVVPGYATVTVTVTVAGDPMAGRPVTVSGVRRRGEEVEESPGQTRPTDEAGRVELLLVDNASDGQADGWTGVGYRFKASTGHGDLWSHDLAPDEPFYKPAFGYPPATGAYLFEIPHGLVETTVTLAYRGDPVPDKGVGVNAYHRDADREVRSTLLYRRTDWPTDEAGQVRFRLWSDYQRFVPEGFDFAIPFGLVDLTTVVTLRGQPLTDSQVGIRWCYRVPDHDVLSPHQRHDIIARTDDAGRARHTLPDDYGVHLEAGQEFVGYLVEVETLLGWIVHRHCRPDAFLPQPGGYPPVPERLDLPFPSGIVESTVTVTLAGDPVPGVPVTVSALRRNAIFELRSDSFSPLTTDEAGRITRRLWDDYQPFVPEGDTFLEYGFSTTVAEIPLYSWQCGLDPYHPGPGGWPPVAEQHELAFPFGRAEVTVIVTQGGESVVSATLEARAVSRVDGIVREMHRGTRTTDEDGRGRFHLWSIPHPHLPDYEGLGFRFSANVDGQTHDSHEAAGPFYVPPDYGYPPQPNDYAFAIP